MTAIKQILSQAAETYGQITSEVRFFLHWSALCLITLTVFRGIFFLVYSSEFRHVPIFEIFKGFIYGLRFDLSVVAMGMALVFLLLVLPFINRLRAFRFIWTTVAVVWFLLIVGLSFADLEYFQHSKKRLGYEAFVYLDSSMFAIVKTSVIESPLSHLLLLAIGAGFFYLLIKYIRTQRVLEFTPYSKTRRIVLLLITLPVLLILVRGGTQRVPLRIADSFISQHLPVNSLTLNSPYMVIRSLGKVKAVKVMDPQRAQDITLGVLGIDGKPPLKPGYPLYRQVEGIGKGQSFENKKNIVLFLMESWPSKYVGAAGDKLDVTPVFNKMARDGLYFKRMFASGYRSVSGLYSTLNGMPDHNGVSLMRRPELMNNYASISALLKKQGYTNIFVHGGLLDFDNLKNMLIHEQFHTMISSKDLHNSGGRKRIWGYDDEYAFKRANIEFRERSKDGPFFGFVYSTTSHSPFSIPEGREKLLNSGDHEQFEFLNTMHYSDWALGEFFKEAREDDYFRDTIFIIVSDHTNHKDLNTFENQNIPLLIYAPGLPELFKPGVSNAIGSNVDIVHTIASLLNLPYQASMGRNLLSLKDGEGSAFWINGVNIGWSEGNYMLLTTPDTDSSILLDYVSGDINADLSNSKPEITKELRTKALAYYQLSADILKNNNLIPPEAISAR
jgi:phosphoglycerol transferase MdoB-like AlkP superfamily enzyme